MSSSNNRNAGRGGKSRNSNNGGRGSGKPATTSPMKFIGMDKKELEGKVIVYSASKLHMTSQYLKFERAVHDAASKSCAQGHSTW